MNSMYFSLLLATVSVSVLVMLVQTSEAAPNPNANYHDLTAIHSGFGHHGHGAPQVAFAPPPVMAGPNYTPNKRDITDQRRRKFFWSTYYNENLKPLLRIIGDRGKLRLKESTIALTETLQEDLVGMMAGVVKFVLPSSKDSNEKPSEES